MTDLFTFHIERTESLDAWRVDDITAYTILFVQFVHLREGCGVFTCIVGIADFAGFQVQIGHQIVDKGRLPYTTIT